MDRSKWCQAVNEHCVWLRKDASGGVGNPCGPLVDMHFSWSGERYVWLVHGYNVDANAAMATYQSFRAALPSRAVARWRICYVFWPGDWWVRLARVVVYPWRLGSAEVAGEEFGRVLDECNKQSNRSVEHIVIAHSLGCRVVLNALAQMETKACRITVVLMAAAVPVSELLSEPKRKNEVPEDELEARASVAEGRWRKALKEKAKVRIVMFSPHDEVLMYAFRIGESVARSGFLPQAVGLHGLPAGIWTERHHMNGFRHSSYWCSALTSEFASGLLWSQVGRRVPTRQSAPVRVATGERVLERRTCAPRRPGV